MRHAIWESLSEHCIEKSNSMSLKKTKVSGFRDIIFFLLHSTVIILPGFLLSACGVSAQYSMTGSTTTAETLSIVEFYNNADLGPANMGQTITNDLKNYFVQNSSLRVIPEEGQLQLE